jgi:hypothetical protein
VNEKSAASRNRKASQRPHTSEPEPIAPALDHPFLNSTQRSGVEFKRERSQRSKRASNARQSEAFIRGGPGASRAPVGSRGNALAAGSRGVSAHIPGGVRGAEPRDAEPKPLDDAMPKQVDLCWLRATSTVRCPLGQQHPTQNKQADSCWLRAKSTVRCPLGQQHPTQNHTPSKPAALLFVHPTLTHSAAPRSDPTSPHFSPEQPPQSTPRSPTTQRPPTPTNRRR